MLLLRPSPLRCIIAPRLTLTFYGDKALTHVFTEAGCNAIL